MISELRDSDNLKEILWAGDGISIIDFYADWCQPCKKISPIVEQISDQADEGVYFYKVDVEKNPELVDHYDIQSMPTLVKLVDGLEVDRLIGAASEDILRNFIS